MYSEAILCEQTSALPLTLEWLWQGFTKFSHRHNVVLSTFLLPLFNPGMADRGRGRQVY